MTPSMAPGVLRLLPLLLLSGRLVAADDGGGENCTATLECSDLSFALCCSTSTIARTH